MSYEQKDGEGSLFVNDKKEAQQQPDYRGSIKIAGVEYWLSGWKKESKGGKRYLSLSAQPKEQTKGKPAVKSDAPPFDDDIGF